MREGETEHQRNEGGRDDGGVKDGETEHRRSEGGGDGTMDE